MISDLKVQEQAKRDVEQTKAMMDTRTLQEHVDHLAAMMEENMGNMVPRRWKQLVTEHGRHLLTGAILADIGITPGAAFADEAPVELIKSGGPGPLTPLANLFE